MKFTGMAALVAALVCMAGCAHTAAASKGPRLYLLDCGDIKPMDPNLFGLKKEEREKTAARPKEHVEEKAEAKTTKAPDEPKEDLDEPIPAE